MTGHLSVVWVFAAGAGERALAPRSAGRPHAGDRDRFPVVVKVTSGLVPAAFGLMILLRGPLAFAF